MFIVLLAGAVASVSGAASWASKPYYTWTDLELKEVLNDSPWADKGGITYNQVKGGSPAAIEDVALVSWVSALPLRQAGVREQLGVTTTPSKEAEAYLAQPLNFYVVAVKGSGGAQSSGYASNAARAQADTFLLRDGKPPIAAAQVEGRQLDKDGKVIETPTPTPAPRGGAPGAPSAPGAPAAPGSPAPAGQSRQMQVIPSAFQGGGGFGGGGFPGGQGGAGANRPRGVASVLIYVFPKTDAIGIDDKEVEFVSKLCGGFGGGFGGGGGGGGGRGAAPGAAPGGGGGGGRGATPGAAPGGSGASTCQFNVKKKFKLKDMMYNGELAL
jgi:hypothetical protein